MQHPIRKLPSKQSKGGIGMEIDRIQILTISLIVLILCFSPLSSKANAVSRGITVKATTPSGTIKEIPLYSGYYALVIGCGNYQKG